MVRVDMSETLILANISNGLVFPHDDVCLFKSCHAQNYKMGYFRYDAMPYKAVIHLLRGGNILIKDASSHNRMSTALKTGVPTWALVFNRAGYDYDTKVCDWQTKEMMRVAHSSHFKPLVQTIRTLIKYYGFTKSVVIGSNIFYFCYPNCDFDDSPDIIKELIDE